MPTRPESSPLGAVTMVPPGGWGLVDNKRNTHTSVVTEVKPLVEQVKKNLFYYGNCIPPFAFTALLCDLPLRVTHHQI